MADPTRNITANSTHMHNVYNATNLNFTTTTTVNATSHSSAESNVRGHPSNLSKITDNGDTVSTWLADIASVNQYAIQKETYEKVAPGTCRWILESPEFDAWMTQGSGTFWGRGIPGAGKTILTSFVVHYLQERSETGPATVFVYCRYNDSLSASNILASLVQQLVDVSDVIRHYVHDELYRECKRKQTKPTQSELEATLRAIVTRSPRFFIILDALDELQESVREAIMDILSSLDQSLFATSRELDIPQLRTRQIRIEAPRRDFETFITGEIGRLPKLRSLLKDKQDVLAEVVEVIRSKADGMFLLSALQVAALGGITTIKTLRKAVRALPTTLPDMYQMTLKRITALSEEERSLALRAILWVTYAIRPLKSGELLAALAVEPDSCELDPEAVTDERTLMSVSCGLLAFNEETGVRLIHYTTHDFFMSSDEPPFDDPHTFAATICAQYRVLSGVDSLPHLNIFSIAQLAQETYPFVDYAVWNLGHHTYQSTLQHQGRLPSHVETFLLSRTEVHGIPLEEPVKDLPSSNWYTGKVTHFAASYGLLDWFERSQSTQALDDLSCIGTTPLMHACAGGHASVVKFLLGTGQADVNALSTDYNEHCWAEDPIYNVLDFAIAGQSIEVVEVLLKYNAAVSRGDPTEGSPLCTAAGVGNVEITQLLLNHPDCTTNVDDVLNSGALWCAAKEDHGDIVKLLLDFPGVDVNSCGPYRSTPLQIAIESNHGRIVRLLLDSPGIDPNARDEDAATALHTAVLYKSEEVINALLRHPDVDIAARDKEGKTVLHYVCRNGNAVCLASLIDSGKIDINEKCTRGWTPLHIASWNGNLDCIRILLDCGSGLEINAKTHGTPNWRLYSNECGSTALDLATYSGYTEVVALLRKAGALRAVELGEADGGR